MGNERNAGKDDKKLDEELRKLQKKEKDKSICPYCNRETEFIWVHGHYQCLICKNVVIGCCGDE